MGDSLWVLRRLKVQSFVKSAMEQASFCWMRIVINNNTISSLIRDNGYFKYSMLITDSTMNNDKDD